MSLWGNKNRVRELEYIMVILMISQQMQPEKHSEHNQVKCSNDKLALFTALAATADSQSASWHGLKRLLIDVRAKAAFDS